MENYTFLGRLDNKNLYKDFYWKKSDNTSWYKDLSVSETRDVLHLDNSGLGLVQIEKYLKIFETKNQENQNYENKCKEIYESGILGENHTDVSKLKLLGVLFRDGKTYYSKDQDIFSVGFPFQGNPPVMIEKADMANMVKKEYNKKLRNN